MVLSGIRELDKKLVIDELKCDFFEADMKQGGIMISCSRADRRAFSSSTGVAWKIRKTKLRK